MCRASDRVNKPILFLPCAQFEDQLPITVGNFVDLAKVRPTQPPTLTQSLTLTTTLTLAPT